MKNIKHLLFLSIICSLVLFTNCGDSDDPVADDTTDTTGDTNTDDDSSETVKYDLTVEISPIEGGLVSYQSGPFTEGTKVTLTATANDNYTFKEWTGAFNGTTNPMELIMNADNSVTAVFELIDADNDGVTDADDICLDTPSIEIADSSGCADSQKDTDGDGVTDDLDLCADTPSGETANVDNNGCSLTQKDTDGDGVTDDLDVCGYSPEGMSVNENGCPDTDGDGVFDNFDLCADTCTGAIVDYNGCSDIQKLNIGDFYQGGIIAYLFQEGEAGYVACEAHGLIAATEDQSTGTEWGCWFMEISGADGVEIGTGLQNTLDIIEGCAEVYGGVMAATIATDYEVIENGVTYNDWFLPSKGEMDKMYETIGKGGSGQNIGEFTGYFYWNSTEGESADDAWSKGFWGGSNEQYKKDLLLYVRSVRYF